MNWREEITIALERIEDGDVPGAVLVLLEALEGPVAPSNLTCSRCSAKFRWPGERDDHERLVHFAEAA